MKANLNLKSKQKGNIKRNPKEQSQSYGKTKGQSERADIWTVKRHGKLALLLSADLLRYADYLTLLQCMESETSGTNKKIPREFKNVMFHIVKARENLDVLVEERKRMKRRLNTSLKEVK